MKRVSTAALALFLPAVVFLPFLPVTSGVVEGFEASEREVKAITAIKEKHEASLFKHQGVIGVGVGLSKSGQRLVIQVYSEKSSDTSSIPSEIEGVPVEIIETGRFRAFDGPIGFNHQITRPRPVPMGTSTGNENGGAATLGFRVRRVSNSSEVGYISANHVAADSPITDEPDGFLCPAQLDPANAPEFDLIQCQPGSADTPFDCHEVKDLAIGKLAQVIPLIMGNKFPNLVDAAFVKSSRACVSKVVMDVGVPGKTPILPKIGAKVQKSGRTTGLTRGIVLSVNATVAVDFLGCGTNGSTAIAKFINQIVVKSADTSVPIDPFALPGDSGAPVLLGKTPVGIVIAAEPDATTTTVTPLVNVLNALAVELDPDPDPKLDLAGDCSP